MQNKGVNCAPTSMVEPRVALWNAAVNFHELGRAAVPGSSGGADSNSRASGGHQRQPITMGAAHCMAMREQRAGRQPGCLIPGCPWEPCCPVGLWEREARLGRHREHPQWPWLLPLSDITVSQIPGSLSWKRPPGPPSPPCDQPQPCQPDHRDGAFTAVGFLSCPPGAFPQDRVGTESVPVGAEGSGRAGIVRAAPVMGPV